MNACDFIFRIIYMIYWGLLLLIWKLLYSFYIFTCSYQLHTSFVTFSSGYSFSSLFLCSDFQIARLQSALENKEAQISNLKSAVRQAASEPRDIRLKSPLSSCSVHKADNSETSKGDSRKIEV